MSDIIPLQESIPYKKKEIEAWALELIQRKLETENTFKLLGEITRLKEMIVVVDPVIRRAAIQEMSSKKDAYHGMELETRGGKKTYDFTVDPVWVRINAMLKGHESRLKALKSATKIADPETGEEYLAQIIPVRQGDDILAVTLK